MRGQRAVLTYHSDIYRPTGSVGGLLLSAYNPFIRRVLDAVTAVITSSPNMVEHSPFLRQYTAKCRVVPMPVDVAAFAEADARQVEEERERFGEFALFTGRLVYYKGVRYLLEALALSTGAKLVIVGEGPLEGELRALAAALDLQHRAVFLKAYDERLRSLYHACSCFVLPSIVRAEAFGIVLAEAMACGKPVISTQLQTGTSYVNIDGQTGLVVPPRDPAALAAKLDVLMTDGELRRAMGERARLRAAAEFDQSIVIESTLSVMYRNY